MKKTAAKSLTITDFILLAVVIVCLFFLFCPYEGYKTLGDRLASDGDMERMTRELVFEIRIGIAAVGLMCAGLLIWKFFAPESRHLFFASLAGLPSRCVHDIRPFFCDLGRAVCDNKLSLVLMLVIFTAGTVIRWLKINSPLMHDEAYSMAIWGRSDLLFAVSDYHLPNNHVFHSVLVNLIYHYIGKSVALLRMPVFLSGCLLIPVLWLLGKQFYDDFVAVTGAGFAAFAPFLIAYSYNARGYEMQAFFAVLTVGLAVYAKRRGNIFSWFLLILFSGLNFFTLPVALYSFGGICVWIFLNVVFFSSKSTVWRSRWHLLKYLLFMGIAVSLLSLLLYTPLLHYSGWNSFFGNIYIGGTEASTFGETMISRLRDNVEAFAGNWPRLVVWSVAFGLILSVFFFRNNSKETISYGLSLFLWIALLIPFQRPNLWPRTLLFLHPFLLLFASSGLSSIRRLFHPQVVCAVLCCVLVTAASLSQMNFSTAKGPDERAVRLILEREGADAENIHFVTAAQDNAPIWIYADMYGLPGKIFDKRVGFNTVYAFVNPLNDSYMGPTDLDDLLARFGPGNNFINFDTKTILMDEPDAILYRFDGKENAIRKGYGDYPEKSK